MAHTGTVLFTIAVSLGLTALVLGAADHRLQDTVPEPPMMVLEIDGETYKGIQADYCWADAVNGSARCVEKIRADKLAVRAALVSRTVERNTTVTVRTLSFRRPDHLGYILMTNEGRTVDSGDAGAGIRLDVPPGTYLLVIDARWQQHGTSRRVYQLEVVRSADGAGTQ